MKFLWQQIGNSTITEILCRQSFDGVVFDTEHGCFNNETLYTCIQIANASNKLCLVRVTDLNKQLIRMCLDANCSGIIMSTVEDYAQAKEFYDFCVYPPEGIRGQGLVRENFWGVIGFNKRTPILIPQIETRAGISNIKEISKLNFSNFLIGPYDLSASFSEPGDFENEDFKLAIKTLKKLLGDKLGYHIVKDVDKQYKELKDCNFLAFGLDTLLLIDGVSKIHDIIHG